MLELPENNNCYTLNSTLHLPVTPPLLVNERVLLHHGRTGFGAHPAPYARRRLCSKGVEHNNPLETLTLSCAECSARTTLGTLWRHYAKAINSGICSSLLADSAFAGREGRAGAGGDRNLARYGSGLNGSRSSGRECNAYQ